jgi:hypothetical protein
VKTEAEKLTQERIIEAAMYAGGNRTPYPFERLKNQRQKRKQLRQNPHMRRSKKTK